jgi:hypothetical protein
MISYSSHHSRYTALVSKLLNPIVCKIQMYCLRMISASRTSTLVILMALHRISILEKNPLVSISLCKQRNVKKDNIKLLKRNQSEQRSEASLNLLRRRVHQRMAPQHLKTRVEHQRKVSSATMKIIQETINSIINLRFRYLNTSVISTLN